MIRNLKQNWETVTEEKDLFLFRKDNFELTYYSGFWRLHESGIHLATINEEVFTETVLDSILSKTQKYFIS